MRHRLSFVLVLLTGACSVYDKSVDPASGGAAGSDPTSGTPGTGNGGAASGGGTDSGTGTISSGAGTTGGEGGSAGGVGGTTVSGSGGATETGGKGGSSGAGGRAGAGGAAGTAMGGRAGAASGGSTASGGSGGKGMAGTGGSGTAMPDAGVRPDAGAVCAPGTCKRVFVSFAVPAPSGKLGGVGAADTFCQSAANAVQLGGTWKAWLSDTSGSPSTRFTQATVPYRLLDGSTIAANWTSLTSGTLMHPINVYEDATPVAAGVTLEVWTGTTPAGAYSGNACANWTNDTATAPNADIGLSNQTGAAWTDIYMQFCNRTTIHVYCFEQ